VYESVGQPAVVERIARKSSDRFRALSSAIRVSLKGRELSLAIGCFRDAQLQGLLFGDEPWKAAGMSRPIGDIRTADLIAS
jgi:hypothetical protein